MRKKIETYCGLVLIALGGVLVLAGRVATAEVPIAEKMEAGAVYWLFGAACAGIGLWLIHEVQNDGR